MCTFLWCNMACYQPLLQKNVPCGLWSQRRRRVVEASFLLRRYVTAVFLDLDFPYLLVNHTVVHKNITLFISQITLSKMDRFSLIIGVHIAEDNVLPDVLLTGRTELWGLRLILVGIVCNSMHCVYCSRTSCHWRTALLSVVMSAIHFSLTVWSLFIVA